MQHRYVKYTIVVPNGNRVISEGETIPQRDNIITLIGSDAVAKFRVLNVEHRIRMSGLDGVPSSEQEALVHVVLA